MDLCVGISGSLIDSSNTAVDGIGHFTQQLIEQLTLSKIKTERFAFPPFRGKASFERSLPMKHSYLLSSGVAALTQGKYCQFDPRVDIFHATDFKIIPMKCPVVATLWDAIPFAHPEWSGRAVKTRITQVLVKRSVRYADHIITASKHAAQDAMKYYGVDEANISILPCGVDDRWFEEVDDTIATYVLKQYGLKEGGYFLSVGTIQPRKNIDRLIDAYLALPLSIRKERKLVLVGRYGWDSEVLVNRIKQLAKEGKLIWLTNVVSDDDLKFIYSKAGVFVFPSLYEGFGLPVVEAFACGIPVIASNATSLPEVTQGGAIEVNPYKVGEMSEAMQILATNSKEYQRITMLGKVRANEYRWKNKLPGFITLYKKIIDGSQK